MKADPMAPPVETKHRIWLSGTNSCEFSLIIGLTERRISFANNFNLIKALETGDDVLPREGIRRHHVDPFSTAVGYDSSIASAALSFTALVEKNRG